MSERMGPLLESHPLVRNDSSPCVACRRVFEAGDYVTLVPLGPGDDEDERAKRDAGRVYNSVSAVVHWDCGPHGAAITY